MKQSSIRSNGFTLIELLVVIAIIAILAAILFPVFAQAKLAAKKTADLSNMKQITTAIAMYTSDYDDLYPFGNFQTNVSATLDHYRWSSSLCLGPYIKNTAVFSTPGDYQIRNISGLPLTPASRVADGRTNSYMANSYEGLTMTGVFPPAYDNLPKYGVFPSGYMFYSYDPNYRSPSSSTSAVANPTEVIMLAGGALEYTEALANLTWTPIYAPNTEAAIVYEDFVDAIGILGIINGTVYGNPNTKVKTAWQKFNGVSNFAFPDGHAKSLSPKSLKQGNYLDPRRFLRDAQ